MHFKGYLYESTGLYRESSLQIVHPDSGDVQKKVSLSKSLFGEGIAVYDNIVYMLTWKEKTMLIFDATSLQLLREIPFHTFSGEGMSMSIFS